MSRMSETPKGVMETYDWQDVAEDLQERIDKAIDFVDSFEYYIPEDDKEDLKYILKGGNNDNGYN